MNAPVAAEWRPDPLLTIDDVCSPALRMPTSAAFVVLMSAARLGPAGGFRRGRGWCGVAGVGEVPG